MRQIFTAMVVDTLSQLHAALHRHTAPPTAWPERRRVLMVSPDHFDVAYAINPHMRRADGALHSVDPLKARQQWEAVAEAYRRIGFDVVVLEGQPKLPDMVFSANQTFPYWSKDGRPSVLLSRMYSPFRQPEVPSFKVWFLENRYEVRELPGTHLFFEGSGDALVQPGKGILWGGVGTRTTADTYEILAAYTGLLVVRLPLVNEAFYHLDTCFSLLDERTVAVVPEAFSKESLRMIHEAFDTVLNVVPEEAMRFLAGNAHSPDGKHVFFQRGAKFFAREVERRGFHPVELETGEFLKSGGSVFCMKQMIF